MTKNIFISGGTSGIGKALVFKFAEKKYNIFFTYYSNIKVAKKISKELKILNINHKYIKMDLKIHLFHFFYPPCVALMMSKSSFAFSSVEVHADFVTIDSLIATAIPCCAMSNCVNTCWMFAFEGISLTSLFTVIVIMLKPLNEYFKLISIL